MKQRWTTRRKLAVVHEVNTGFLGFQEACDRYDLSGEELKDWLSRAKIVKSHKALKATVKKEAVRAWAD